MAGIAGRHASAARHLTSLLSCHARCYHDVPGGFRVLAWGSGAQGALGRKDEGDWYEPEPVPGLPEDLVGVGAGHYTSFALTSSGEVWSWGANDVQQLGRRLQDAPYVHAPPGPILGLTGVVSVVGSGVAGFAITADGDLYSWGSSRRGQLGLGPGVTTALGPRRVEALRGEGPVREVSVGWGHALALTVDGGVYSWGWPGAGQLGHTWVDVEADEEVQAAAAAWLPRRVTTLDGRGIVQVRAGYDHSMALDGRGRLYTFGDNSLGQLGREAILEDPGTGDAQADAWLVHGAPPLTAMAAGLGHCLALTRRGELYSWGWNAAGQLGLGAGVAADIVRTPSLVYGLPRNSHALLAAGRVHSVLVTDERDEQEEAAAKANDLDGGMGGMCATWGSGAGGRLGTGQVEEVHHPELLPLLDGEEVAGLAAGLDHTLILAR